MIESHAKGLPPTPPLSDEVVSRESFSDARDEMSVLFDDQHPVAPGYSKTISIVFWRT